METQDGRHIDLLRATLSGEGAFQQVTAPGNELPAPSSSVLPYRSDDPTYYDRPVIKQSVWTWTIPLYYYVGGLSGAVAVLGAAATLLDRNGMPNVVRRSRWLSAAGATISAALLIHDLGRPSRFLHMMRVFRPSSPMNMGTWILISFSSATSLAALALRGPAPWRAVGDAAALGSGVLGLGLSGYTGVLVANTAVPVWQLPHRLLPVLFLSSATASAASVFDLMDGTPSERHASHYFGLLGKIAELSAAAALERRVAAVPAAVRPLRSRFSGLLWRAGMALSAASLVVSLLSSGKGTRRAAGVLGTMGALCVRFGIHYAGQRSAMDPRASFHQQRQGQGAFQITGVSAVVGANEQRAFEPTNLEAI